MYDGTLARDWRALVTMQQLVILCDEDGVVDMTHDAIARRTGIPIDVIRAGIEFLESPDPESRSPAHGGRRIVRLDEHRDWGWRLVNYEKYEALGRASDKRAADRERIASKRRDAAAQEGQSPNENASHSHVAFCREVSQGVASCRDVQRDDYQADAQTSTAVADSGGSGHQLALIVNENASHYGCASGAQASKVVPPPVTPLSRVGEVEGIGKIGGCGGKEGKGGKERGGMKTLRAWLAELNGGRVLRDDDPLYAWADSAGIPRIWLRYAWEVFRARYIGSDKRYADWRQAFRTHCRLGYLRVWRLAADGKFVLTEVGAAEERALARKARNAA